MCSLVELASRLDFYYQVEVMRASYGMFIENCHTGFPNDVSDVTGGTPLPMEYTF